MKDNIKGTKIGTVISDKMEKTIVVAVDRVKQHRLYKKKYTETSKFKVDDPKNEHKIGDRVEITPVRPIAKNKFYKVSKKVSN